MVQVINLDTRSGFFLRKRLEFTCRTCHGRSIGKCSESIGLDVLLNIIICVMERE